MNRKFLLVIIVLASIGLISICYLLAASGKPQPGASPPSVTERLSYSTKIAEARRFVKENRHNDSLCFLINMNVESGSNRFTVYDIKKDSVILTGLVTHGRCNKNWLVGRRYSNEPGCGCSSLGKYKIGKSYMGKFGLAYKLHGLESTNSNAYKRYVVLHSHGCVPEGEVNPAPICQSDGCPTVSPAFFDKLAKIINHSKKPILLWIFDDGVVSRGN
ncbi:MAG: murein L,D-transpeptidase catalytic domain family protein [Chitinophagaceae bacterium]|nr:murein L,D-transpeptidase catalytic domain family protein [Chitinophagaceae bacterium]